MPRNGSGTYTLPVNSFNPAINNTVIDPSDWNDTAADLATALTNSLIIGTTQVVTAGPTAAVAQGTSLVIVNQTVGAPITLTLPASATQPCPIKIVDWKGDSGTNAITITPNGVETFSDAQTSWIISSAGASVIFTPYSGQGYAV